MLEKAVLEKYLSLAMSSQADFAEIYEEKEINENISMRDGLVEDVDTEEIAGIGIRLYKGTQSVYAYSHASDEAAVLPMIEDLKAAIGTSDKTASVTLTRVDYENRHPVKVDFTKTPLADRVQLLTRATNAAR